MPSTFIAVDIGSNSLKLSYKNSRNITCCEPFPIPDNLVNNSRIVSSEVMASVINQAVKLSHLHIKDSAVVIPSDKSYIKRTTVAYMPTSQLMLNLPFEFNDYIPKDKDLYYYDYAVEEVINNAEGKPEKLDILAAAVEKKTVEDYFDLFTKAGLRIRTAIPEIFAYRNLVEVRVRENPSEKDKVFCFLDLGHSSIRMHIFKGASYETTRVIDYSGESLIDSLKETLRVDSHVALAHFRANQDNIQSSETCLAFYRNIAVEVKRAADFYSYYKSGNTISEIFLCGGLSYTRELVNALRSNLDMQITEVSKIMPKLSRSNYSFENHLTVGTILQCGEGML